MISALKIFESPIVDPYRNIAAEKHLTKAVGEGEMILFLWQNRRTVVIGKNQNLRAECRVERLLRDGGHPARRLSGGGAVYHDEGNLNVSFIARKPDYDTVRQTNVLLKAVRRLGVPAERTGRNDLTADGRKFSGHAYYEKGSRACHHACVMMAVDEEALSRYLTVSSDKLASHGVPSVRSRVVNLRDYVPDICRETLSLAIREAAEEEYGLTAAAGDPSVWQEETVQKDAAWLASEAWLYGRNIPFTADYEARFSWGSLRLQVQVNEGRIRDAVCFSDVMDEAFPAAVQASLQGVPFDSVAVSSCLLAMDGSPERQAAARELADFLRKKLAE